MTRPPRMDAGVFSAAKMGIDEAFILRAPRRSVNGSVSLEVGEITHPIPIPRRRRQMVSWTQVWQTPCPMTGNRQNTAEMKMAPVRRGNGSARRETSHNRAVLTAPAEPVVDGVAKPAAKGGGGDVGTAGREVSFGSSRRRGRSGNSRSVDETDNPFVLRGVRVTLAGGKSKSFSERQVGSVRTGLVPSLGE